MSGLFEDDNKLRGKKSLSDKIREKTKKPEKIVQAKIVDQQPNVDAKKLRLSASDLARVATAGEPDSDFSEVNIKSVAAKQSIADSGDRITPPINYISDDEWV